jgi:hypothetical protein
MHINFNILLTALAGIIFITNVNASDNAGKAYGKTLTLKDTTRISQILADPDKFVGKQVLVKGRIVDVCKKRGCWMELAGDKEFQTFRIKVNDGEIVFPLEAKGKLALVEGTVEKFTLTKEQTIERLKHHAEEQGEKFDSAIVKEGMNYFQIKGSGAVIY